MRNARAFYFLFLLLPALLFSCRKNEPTPETGTPVFYATGALGSASIALHAGEDDYYMYSSYSSDANDIYEYKGELKKENCASPCPQSLVVRIRDYATHTSSQTNIATALAPGLYNFVVPDSGYLVSFTSNAYADSISSWSWTFGDNGIASVPNPVHIYAMPGIYNACLSITSLHNNQACNSMHCDSVYVGPPACMQPSFTATDVDLDTIPINDSLQFDATVNGGTGPYTYEWSFGDSFSGNGQSILHTYFNPGVYTVRLAATDASSCTIVKKMQVLTSHADQCMANFSWQAQSGFNFSEVTIEWTDANGTVYSSATGPQPGTSSFELVSVEEYAANENQQPTKKIHLLVTCTLYSSLNSIVLQNADVVFAVAYP